MKYKLKEHMILLCVVLAYLLFAASITMAHFLEWSITGIVLVVLSVLACGFLTYSFVYDLKTFLKKKKEAKEKEGNELRGE